MIKYRYVYNGPVMVFDKLASNKWKGETIALNEKKALSNLSYTFKKNANLLPSSRVTLLSKYLKATETAME